MITPRTTRLVRAPSLHTFQRAILAACGPDNDVARTLVLVPSRTAARRLKSSLDDASRAHGRPEHTPDVLTRSQMYEVLAGDLPDGMRWLTPFERDVMLEAAAHEAVTEGMGPPFNLRPGLIGEMLVLYDELRRHRQDVADFERLLVAELEPRAGSDRGAERVLRQTRFLASAFHSYERHVAERDAADEHVLRARLLAREATSRWTRVIVTVGDRSIDRSGLWPADFDLLTRADGITEIVVVATEARLAAGLHVRIQDLLPGIEESRLDDVDRDERPRLLVPSGDVRHFTSRDREDELTDVIRRIRAGTNAPLGPAGHERTAIVFARPLPYVYLAREVCASAQLPFQTDDSLPLAAEPAAAAIDLVLAFVATGLSRRATVELLRSPHFDFSGNCAAADWQDAIHALDVSLAEAGYLGDLEQLRSYADEWARSEPRSDRTRRDLERTAAPAAAAAAKAAGELSSLFGAAPAVAQLTTLRQFLENRQTAAPADRLSERDQRARAAILLILDGLIDAYSRRTELSWTVDSLAATLRRWIEAETFVPRVGAQGLQLIDAAAARYGSFDEVHLVGLVDGEWPERQRGNIFYSPFLLKQLGWTDDGSRSAAERADFLDLLQLARYQVGVSTFQLEDDGLVEPSPLLDELIHASLEPQIADASDPGDFVDEALIRGVGPDEDVTDLAREWLTLRTGRESFDGPEFHGTALSDRREEYGVSGIELYEQCPFKYFARYVLRLREESGEEGEGLTPRDRGIFVHEVLHAFFDQWQASGHGAITPESLDEAYRVLGEVAEPRLAALSPIDSRLERVRIFGSAVAPGVADLVFRMEAERLTPVISRRLEERFRGVFQFRTSGGLKPVPVRGIADRLDLLADGSVRVLDYKASVPLAALQLAIYAVTSLQRLQAETSRPWNVGEVAYVVYGGQRTLRSLGRSRAELERVLDDAQERFAAAVAAVESGRFPPRPTHPRLCTTCAYAAVCRKDYVVKTEHADAAPAL